MPLCIVLRHLSSTHTHTLIFWCIAPFWIWFKLFNGSCHCLIGFLNFGNGNTGMLLEGTQHQLLWISNHQHLIQKRRCGQDFLLKDQSILLLISHAIFGGKTTAPWSSGLSDICGLSTLMLLISLFFAQLTDLMLLLLPVSIKKLSCSFVLCSRTLRKLFDVDPADYMISICGDEALRELSSPGKSGSFFYLTNDDKYMIKTMKKSEVKVSLFGSFIHTLP